MADLWNGGINMDKICAFAQCHLTNVCKKRTCIFSLRDNHAFPMPERMTTQLTEAQRKVLTSTGIGDVTYPKFKAGFNGGSISLICEDVII